MNKMAFFRNTNTYLIGAVLIIGIFLVARNQGLYPGVSDEYAYSLYARLVPFRDSVLPNYLYFWIYRTTNLCGDGFLGCSRLLNVVFFVSAAPFIYLLGRRITGEKAALLVAVLSILGPVNTYTAYFMPESFYFLAFWVFTYLALGMGRERPPSRWLLLGMVFGLIALVKPHALFLLPPLAVYFVLRGMKTAPGTGHTMNCLGFFASAIVTRLGIGLLLAGSSGISLFGPYYQTYASGSVAQPNHYIDLMKLATENLQGHLLALAILFSVPIAHIILASKYFLRRSSDRDISKDTALYAALVLAGLLAVTALFTASAAASPAHESNVRLHMRYYDFALPLLFLISASQLSLDSLGATLRSRSIVGLVIGAAILYAVHTHLAPYTPNLIDSPELRGFTYDTKVFYCLGGLSFLSLAAWIYAARAGANMFVYLFMPLAVVFSTYYANVDIRQNMAADVFNKAGLFTRHYLSKEESSKLVIASSDTGRMLLSLLSIDSPRASYETIPKGAVYDISKFPIGKEWLLLIGEHPLPENRFFQIPMEGFTLVHVAGANSVDFTQSSWHGVVLGARGLHPAEPWGTWSSGNSVSLEFLQPLPAKFTARLVASAFGPNAGKEFVAHVGDSAIGFTLENIPRERVLEFQNPARSATISIDVPIPTSPKELGLSADERKLGIGLTKLRIEPR